MTVREIIRAALRTIDSTYVPEREVDRAAGLIVNMLSEKLGADALRAEITEVTHTQTHTERTYVTKQVLVDRHRRCWTEKERAFKLAMMRIHARGEKPTKTRISIELGRPRYRSYWAKPDDPGKFQLSGRMSAWQREMYQQLGYRMEGQYWVHERDKPLPKSGTVSVHKRTERHVR